MVEPERAITLHPRVQFLRAAIASIIRELRELLYRWFILTCQERPKLLERYDTLFGDLERALQRETLRTWKVQRVCELVNLFVRRGQHLTPSLLERICQYVEREYRRFQAESPRTKSPSRPDAGSDSLSTVRTQQCIQLYRELVKKLHPDREGDVHLFALYWNVVQDAYERGDVERLRTIHGILCIEGHYRIEACDSLESLSRTYRRLLYRRDYEQRRIERMLHEEPFTFATVIDDPTWRATQQAKLAREIERQRRTAELAAAELLRMGAHNWEELLHSASADAIPNDVFQDEFFKHTYGSMRA
jgi:hypothetical protein